MPPVDPTISVIIPVFNGERFLREAIVDVGAQNYGPLDLIVVDDGSTDESAAILEEFSGRIRVFRQSNRGPAAARNLGIAQSHSDWVAFHDVDDLWAAGSLMELARALTSDPDAEFAQGLIQRMELTDASNTESPMTFEPIHAPYRFVNLGSCLFRRSLFDRLGTFDETLWENEDTDFFVRAWETNTKRAILDRVILLYRLHDRNMVHSQQLVHGGMGQMMELHKKRVDGRFASGRPTRPPATGLYTYLGSAPPLREPVPSPGGDATPAATAQHFHLARAWARRGHMDRAISHYLSYLAMEPETTSALQTLAELMLLQGHFAKASEFLAQARLNSPSDVSIKEQCEVLDRALQAGKALDHPVAPATKSLDGLKENPEGKLSLSDQKVFGCHRSGWDFALDILRPLHNSGGVKFDGFLENNFAWLHRMEGMRPPEILDVMRRHGILDLFGTSEERGITPYNRCWVGVFHNPPNMPRWFRYQDSPQTIIAKDVWKRSVEHCRGLFALSDYSANWLRSETGLTVSRLWHPTEFPDVQFDFERFQKNQQRKIVQIGWWLRDLNAIYRLPIPALNPLGYEKVNLVPTFFSWADDYLGRLRVTQAKEDGLPIPERFAANTRESGYLTAESYDELLSANIVFLHLYDASANNTIIECIARATPILVNPLPAVVEYLGGDYPLYFNDLDEAAAKAMDLTQIRRAHAYLQQCPTRSRLSKEYFLEDFRRSAVYSGL